MGGNGAKQAFLIKARSPKNVNRNMPITQFSVGYIGALLLTGTELPLLLTLAGAAPSNIQAIASAADTCTGDEVGDDAATCAICLPDAMIRVKDAGAFAELPNLAAVAAYPGSTFFGMGVAAAVGAGWADMNEATQGATVAGSYPAAAGLDDATWAAMSAEQQAGTVAAVNAGAKATAGMEDFTCMDPTANPLTAGCCYSGGKLAGVPMANQFCHDDTFTGGAMAGYPKMKGAYVKVTALAANLPGQGPAKAEQTDCASFTGEDSKVMGLVNLLSQIDGGTVVKKMGDKAHNVAGGMFTVTAFNEPRFYAPLIQTHSANDIFYGYPSAIVGTAGAAIGGTVSPANLEFSSDYLRLCESQCDLDVATGQELVTMQVVQAVGGSAVWASMDAATQGATFAGAIAGAAGLDGATWAAMSAEQQAGATNAVYKGAAAQSPHGYKCTGKVLGRDELATEDLGFSDMSCQQASWTFAQKFMTNYLEDNVRKGVIGNCYTGAAGSGVNAATLEIMGGWAAAAPEGDASGAEIADFSAAKRDHMYTFCHTSPLISMADALVGIMGAADKATALVLLGLPDTATDEQLIWGYAGASKVACADGTAPYNEDGTVKATFMGCCISAGGAPGNPFTGYGCFAPMPGFYDVQASNNDIEESLANHNAALAPHLKEQKLMCPDEPKDISDYSMQDGKSSIKMYNSGTAALPVMLTTTVSGGDGKLWEPQGVTSSDDSKALSASTTNVGMDADAPKLWVKQMSRVFNTMWDGTRAFGLDYSDLMTAVYRPDKKVLWETFAANGAGTDLDNGAGKEWRSVQPLLSDTPTNATVAEDFAPSAPGGLPLYMNHANFLNSDPEQDLLTSQEIWTCLGADYDKDQTSAEYVMGANDHTDITATNCSRITDAWLEMNRDKLDTLLYVEPATGMTIAGYKKLGASIKPVSDCNPAMDGNCLLSINPVATMALSGYEGCHGGALGQAIVGGLEASLGAAEGSLMAALTGSYQLEGITMDATTLGFSCSAANVIAPAFKGGHLHPVYWASQWSDLREAADSAKALNGAKATAAAIGAGLVMILVIIGAAFMILGIVCIAACGGSAEVKAAG